ncbi:hypothetical protein HN858_05085 [Candidatus Falkowbacteria bacterium]|jgi:sugar-specific transcriptional regulator TrmB|nr:hypothetical protein [Candidatus Falkowbacteria bacterium]MBT5502590.1 hypothetical protein [Candidatus Falkowbacteria bacterium]MBT6574601.1 hypothetical protein [Candidatus Falkowbacteria bacterium]MBT7349012.1 hypothetical protein [Candidatus Falkowbacteria bacterium]MBT7500354.1 hypothetical protein [Candidatus Falkowbacteria bacterium]
MLKNQLKNLGFTENESSIYLALFDLGKSRAGQIIEHTSLHRNLVYTALDSLENRQLVTKVMVKGVAEFSANSPTSLIDEIDNKKQLAIQAVEQLKKMSKQEERDIKIYEGLDGIKQARSRILNLPKGSEFFVLGASKLSQTPELESFWRGFHKKREAKGIKQKLLYESTTDKNVLDSIKWRNQLPNMESRFLPFEIDSPFWFDFAEDQVNLGFAGQDPLTINIKSRDLVNGFKKYFEYFWDQRVLVKTGVSAVKEALYEQLNSLEPGEEYRILGAKGKDYPQGVDELFNQFHLDRIKKGVVTKMICYEESYNGLRKRFETCGDISGKISFLKKYTSETPIPMQINMYKDKTFFILYEKTPVVVYFDNPVISQTFNTYFNDIWDQKVTTKTGTAAFHDAMYNLLDELEAGDEYYILGTTGRQLDEDENIAAFYNKFHKARIKKGIKVKMLCYEEAYKNIKNRFNIEDPKGLLSKLKIYTTASANPMQICLYKKKAHIIIYEKEPTVISFDKPEVFEGFKNQFDKAWDQKIQVYHGREGLRNVIRKVLDMGDYVAIGGAEKIVDALGADFFRWWQKEKRKRGIKTRVIMGSHHKKTPSVTDAFAEFKFVHEHEAPGVTLIFKDKVIILSLEGEPAAFIIEDKTLAKTNRQYFDELWNKDTYILKGVNAVGDLFNEMLQYEQADLIGARGYFIDKRPEFTNDWEKRAIKKGFKMRNIVAADSKGHRITKFPFAKTKYTLKKEFSNLSVFWIFGNKVAISNWTKKDPIVVVIENKHVHDMYKQQFESLWNQ